MRNGKLLNWDSYLANFATYAAFVGTVLCYEFSQRVPMFVFLGVTVLLTFFDIIQDVREVLNFSFGVCFFDNCTRTSGGISRPSSNISIRPGTTTNQLRPISTGSGPVSESH